MPTRENFRGHDVGTAIFRLIFKKIKIRHFYAKCLIFIMRFYEFLCNSLEFTCFSSFFNGYSYCYCSSYHWIVTQPNCEWLPMLYRVILCFFRIFFTTRTYHTCYFYVYCAYTCLFVPHSPWAWRGTSLFTIIKLSFII